MIVEINSLRRNLNITHFYLMSKSSQGQLTKHKDGI